METSPASSTPNLECLAEYVPTHVDLLAWEQVAGTVRAAVGHATESVSTAVRYRSHAAAFAVWALREGIAGAPAVVFRSDVVERYIEIGMPRAAESSRATRRSILRRIVRHATECPHSEGLPSPIAYRRVRAPYTSGEVSAYTRMAESQPTRGRRQSLLAILGLGLGCGLDGGDMGWIRGCDVRRIDDGAACVTVCGGRRPRSVISLRQFESQILALAEDAGPTLLIGGSVLGRHNVTSVTLGRLINDSTLDPLVVGRLRSTWLLNHLRANTPLGLLMAAAGLQTVRPLEDLLHHLPDPPAADLIDALRGPV